MTGPASIAAPVVITRVPHADSRKIWTFVLLPMPGIVTDTSVPAALWKSMAAGPWNLGKVQPTPAALSW